MKKRIILKAITIMGIVVASVLAFEPNFVRTKTYGVGTDTMGTVRDAITTNYYDGMSREIQSKKALTTTKDRTVCTYYDNAGRQKYVTKPFTDNVNYGVYLPGDLAIINAAGGPLQTQYSTMPAADIPYAYSSIEYHNDPLSRIKENGIPGAATQAGMGLTGTSRVWYFSTGLENPSSPITTDAGGTTYNITFSDGFISSINPVPASETIRIQILDALYEKFNGINPFSSTTKGITHFLTVSKDADNRYSEERKDILNKTKKTMANIFGSGNPVITGRQYDILGNLTLETPPAEGTTILIDNTIYTYNTLGWLLTKTTPDAGIINYDYYDDGQIKTITTKSLTNNTTALRTLTYQYDNLNRVIGIMSSGQPVIKNYYDEIIQAQKDGIDFPASYHTTDMVNLRGKLVASVSYNFGNGINQKVIDLYSYDDEGRIYKKYKKIPGMQMQEITYTYDLQGKINIEEFLYNNQDKIIKKYNYDELGQIKNIVHSNNDNKKIMNYLYNDLGQINTKEMSAISITGGYSQSFGYSIRDQLKQVTSSSGQCGFSENIPDDSYSPAGNILAANYQYNRSAPPLTFGLSYTYDGLNRLTQVVASPTTPDGYNANYSYDAAGRFTSKKEGSDNITDYEYYHDSSNYSNRLKKNSKNGSDKDYIYDAFGNLVVDLRKNMLIEYDWRDMPIAFRFYSNLSSVVTKTVNAIGTTADPQLVKTIIGNSTALMISQVVMLYDAAGKRVAKLEGK